MTYFLKLTIVPINLSPVVTRFNAWCFELVLQDGSITLAGGILSMYMGCSIPGTITVLTVN